jgi:uncharacterized membrane protein YfcA
MPESPSTIILLVLSAAAAGVVNSLAGGGTLLTFPPLTAVMSKVLANGTSTVALLPGSLAGAWGYRRELRAAGRWPILLVLPSLAGGWIGTKLVTRLPESYFAAAVPWLILSATLLFLSQPTLLQLVLRKRPAGESLLSGGGCDPANVPHDGRGLPNVAVLTAIQFLIAIYGGYFGAGIGILMLSSLGLMGVADIHQMNAIKTVLAGCMNAMSVVVFAQDDKVVWPIAGLMAAAAIVGGFLGAHYGRRLPRWLVRWTVIVIGFALAAKYFAEQFTA